MRVLYVGDDRVFPASLCPGSLVCVSLVETIRSPIHIQHCKTLIAEKALPAWLDGTPIFADDQDTHGPYRGTDAVRELQRIQREEALAASTAEAVRPPPPPAQRPTKQAKLRPPDPPPLLDEPPDEDDGRMDATQNGVTASRMATGKVTDQDLQAYMEARKNSPASSTAPTA